MGVRRMIEDAVVYSFAASLWVMNQVFVEMEASDDSGAAAHAGPVTS